MEQNNKNNKPIDEKGCAWVRYNGKNQEYLSIKLNINGEDLFFKGFLNSKKQDPNDSKPKFIIYKSQDNSKNKEEINHQDKEYTKLLERDRNRILD